MNEQASLNPDVLNDQGYLIDTLNRLALFCHARNEKWWRDPITRERIERNPGEMIALMHSELSEMLEGVRKSLMDSHCPEFKNEEVELADLLIRAFDYAKGRKLRIGEAFAAKMAYNDKRQDHTFEARAALDGKKF